MLLSDVAQLAVFSSTEPQHLAQLAVLSTNELLQTTPATLFSSLSLAPVNRSDVVQLAVASSNEHEQRSSAR